MTAENQSIGDLIKKYWFAFAVVGSLVAFYFELKFVVAAVNPESIAEYREHEAILSTKREIRYCLQMEMMGDYDNKEILRCAK